MTAAAATIFDQNHEVDQSTWSSRVCGRRRSKRIRAPPTGWETTSVIRLSIDW